MEVIEEGKSRKKGKKSNLKREWPCSKGGRGSQTAGRERGQKYGKKGGRGKKPFDAVGAA